MAKFLIVAFLLLLPLFASRAQKQVHIVYFGEHSGKKASHEIENTHHSYLVSVKNNEEEARAALLYSYKHSINGFAAVLSPDEASKLSEMEEVVSVFPSGQYSMHTTRSWEFVGLLREEVGRDPPTHFKKGSDLLSKAKYGQDVIVGVIDTGVWPESESFIDRGMGPIPKSWKGLCQSGHAFNSSHCNRKLIGARYYSKGFEHKNGPLNPSEDYRSCRDINGHGTHTASTVGGRMVHNVSAIGGFARGTASGGAPLVRLAIYKICWDSKKALVEKPCHEEDFLAAIDDAIDDGVNVVSISLGEPHNKYTDDPIAIGALHAVRNNIVVVCSAGNDGPRPSTLLNLAPWIITVGASSVDRKFPSPVMLGNGKKIKGQSATPNKLKKKMYPLVYAVDVSKDKTGQCLPQSLSTSKVKGKIVVCMSGPIVVVEQGMEVKRAGGAGFILGNNRAGGADELASYPNVLPATVLVYTDAIRILEYINSTQYPVATIIPARTVIRTKPAPYMASFSSRGPNVIDPNILKPDMTAPGLNILAAWSEKASPSGWQEDHRVVKFNMISGTSMSCPHVAAAAALLKAIHPTWSTAAIRSALMTTASVINNNGLPLTDEHGKVATPFAYGSGHFQPTKAADPGLVYDAYYTDYLLYLCSLGSIKKFDKTFKCPEQPPTSITLNYPSLAVSKLNGTVSVKRTVTNVGGGGKSIYFFTSQPPVGISINAYPSILVFDHVGQKKSFTITLGAISDEILRKKKDEYGFGWYKWTDTHALHVVRSPIAVSLA